MTKTLPPNHFRVLQLLADGYSCKEIAEMVYMAPSSVHTLVIRLRTKYKARNVTHLVYLAFKDKVVNI